MSRPRRLFAAASRFVLCSSLCGVGTAAAQEDAPGFEFSGAQRTRYETLDPQFRAGFSNSDQAVALQTTLVFNWRRGSWLVGGEVMDSRSYANDSGSLANGTTTNVLEPIQAYVAWRHDAGTLRVGRVSQDIGKRRLVGRNRYRNTVNNFTGIDWSWTGADGRAARAFYWVPMRPLPADQESVLDNEYEHDTGVRGAHISGLFFQFPAYANELRLESYVFDAKAASQTDPALAFDLVTAGARVYRSPQPSQWSYEVEAVLQSGESGGAAGSSAGRHLEGSFTWTAIPDRSSLETGFAHVWAGRFAEQTAGAAFRGDPQYYYVALTTSF